MAAKSVQVSTDNITFLTLPGSSGSFAEDADSLEDTIFGQQYSSAETGLISLTSDANSRWKGFAGYVTQLKSAGTPTAFTAEAMSVVTGQVYSIDDATKNVWDRNTAVTIFDGVTDVTAEVVDINYLFGQITFDPAYTVVGVITADGSSQALAAFGKAKTVDLTQSAEAVDTSDLTECGLVAVGGNGGFRTYRPGLKTVGLSLGGFFEQTNGFKDLLEARSEIIVEIGPDGSLDLSNNANAVARGYFKPMSTSQSGDVGGDESEDVSFELSVPYNASISITPFQWAVNADSTIPSAIALVLTAWQAGDSIFVKYVSPDPSTEVSTSAAVITDLSLSTGVDSMAEFSLSFQLTGAPTRTS